MWKRRGSKEIIRRCPLPCRTHHLPMAFALFGKREIEPVDGGSCQRQEAGVSNRLAGHGHENARLGLHRVGNDQRVDTGKEMDGPVLEKVEIDQACHVLFAVAALVPVGLRDKSLDGVEIPLFGGSLGLRDHGADLFLRRLGLGSTRAEPQ